MFSEVRPVNRAGDSACAAAVWLAVGMGREPVVGVGADAVVLLPGFADAQLRRKGKGEHTWGILLSAARRRRTSGRVTSYASSYTTSGRSEEGESEV